MRRFTFALEPVLRLRRASEQGQQRVVAELERKRLGLEQRIRTLQQQLADGKAQLRLAITGSVEIGELRQHGRESIETTRKANRLVLELAGIHSQLEKARAALAKAVRDRRAIELLREQRHEEWTADMRREEQIELDDLAVAAAAIAENQS